MPRLSPPVMAAQLRNLLLRRQFFQLPPRPRRPTIHDDHHRHFLYPQKPSLPKPYSLLPYSLFLSKHFSSETHETWTNSLQEEHNIAESLSLELHKDPEVQTLPLAQRLDVGFSHINLTASVILTTLNLSRDTGRTALDFHKWVSSRTDFKLNDETVAHFTDFFGRRKDFKAIHEVLITSKGISGVKTFRAAIDRLVKAGRPTKTVDFFEKMEREYGLVRNLDSLKWIVYKFCQHGFASYAEKMVKNLANEFFPDEFICDTLIKGWCADGKLEEARRLSQEMHRGGFDIGPVAYNAILDCVCKLCRDKDPFRLQSEAEKVLIDMDVAGVPRNVVTFNVLINHLCKIRKTQEAMNLFERMGEWGCHPNEKTFIFLINSLYQAARIGEGDEMIDKMKSAGFGSALDKKAYYEFLKTLCGIQRIDHAMIVFANMKKDGCEPGIKTYGLLMRTLCAHRRVEKANQLFKEAESRGVPVVPKAYIVDCRFVKKPTVVKKEKKRETLPEKMAKKRRRLSKLRLSFVKKPKNARRRAY